MNVSTSPGRLSARSRSGSVTSSTTRVSLQAMKPRARTTEATKRSLDIVYSSTEKMGLASPPGDTPGVEDRSRLLERRAQSDREGTEVRERERVHRIDGRRTRAVQLGPARQTHLGIEAAIAGEREQIAAHEADVPITRPGDRTDVVGDEQLAQLRVARIFHRRIVGEQLVVEPAEPGKAVLARRAPVVPDGLRVFNRLPDLIDVVRQEVEVRPVEALVPDLLAHRGIDQRIEAELLDAHVLRDGEPEVRQSVSERHVPGVPVGIAQQDRHAPVQLDDSPR